MRPYLLSVLCLPILIHGVEPLSDSEADAIIAADVAMKTQRKNAKAPSLHVLEQREIIFEGNQRFVLQRVSRPELPARSRKAKIEAESDNARPEIASFKTLTLTAWVYDREISNVRFTDPAGNSISIWVRIDMSLSRVIGVFSGIDTTYRVVPFVQNISKDDLRERQALAAAKGVELPVPQIPSLPDTSNDGYIEYYVDSETQEVLNTSEAFEGIDALLLYIEDNKADLAIALSNQETLVKARQRHDAQNPKSKAATITYWIPAQ